MGRYDALSEQVMFDAKTTEDLVTQLNQSLVDALDLAYQTKLAHWSLESQKDARDIRIHLDTLVDRYRKFAQRMRMAIRSARELEDRETADLYTTLYTAVGRSTDKALWMLREGGEA